MRGLAVTGVQIFFFFFQAEDGIRDVAMTGVQTCALPILLIVTSPLHWGVKVYQTSGVLTELPQGSGIEPRIEGVAQMVEPQAAGAPTVTGMALLQKSLDRKSVV